MSRLIFLGCLAYLTIGLGQLVLGAVMEPMVHAYGIQYGDGGQLVMHQFLGGLVGTLCSPWLINRIGRKSLLLAAFGIMAVIEFLYMALPPWGVMLSIAPVTGFGFGIVEALVGSLIIGGAGEKANVAMTRVETFFGIGALIIPFAGAALIELGQWRMAFGVVGLLSVASLFCWWRFWPAGIGQGAAGAHGAGDAPSSSGSRLGRNAAVVMGACILFFVVYVGLEMSFVHYLPSVLVNSDEGLTEATATLALSVFWGAMTIGRMFAGAIADRFGGGPYLLGTCFAAAICFALMSLTGGVTAMFVLTFFAGLALSGIFAVALVFTNRAVPGMTERTTSLLIASGLLGGAILPKLAGWSLDRFEVGMTRWLFTAVAVLMVVIIGVALAYSKRSSERPAIVAK
ncbi:hypothetical protein J19TS2_49480 [Cohnella xylanilytica]|uniref:MFS transporter n=1 Tax=Cohnella xylanilytica TaxID=557555 RepID=A0A841TY37_9BACL|nr:MFS transporter [Cohnella xylanilytica]MBB6691063.1 MFS transporter [Cohnella xylanilytica]GIO15393.1 hypothetical protein J19TS2_49480 [Cohnella xylanilytica]